MLYHDAYDPIQDDVLKKVSLMETDCISWHKLEGKIQKQFELGSKIPVGQYHKHGFDFKLNSKL